MGQWPHEGVDFTGQRVTVFQQTPDFSVPACNAPLSPECGQEWKSSYPERRARARTLRTGTIYDFGETSALAVSPEQRRRDYAARWERGSINVMAAYTDLVTSKAANDPAVAETLVPTNHPIGTKRICVDTGYYEAFNRSNVTLVDLQKSPTQEVTPAGIRAQDAEYAVDSIVYTTGFDAMTGALLKAGIRGAGCRSGRNGQRVRTPISA